MRLGKFEHAVLSAVFQLGENAYGTPIWRVVDNTLQKNTSVGALYTTLERMVRKGLLETYMGERTEERGGRAKRYFRVTGSGQAALEASTTEMERLLRTHPISARILGRSVVNEP